MDKVGDFQPSIPRLSDRIGWFWNFQNNFSNEPQVDENRENTLSKNGKFPECRKVEHFFSRYMYVRGLQRDSRFISLVS